MSTLTIHALDPAVERRIRLKARREGWSLNRTIKSMLADSTDGRTIGQDDHRGDFAEFCGIWSEGQAREVENALADCEVVNEADWK